MKGIYLDLWWPGRCSLEHCPAMRWWGLPAVATGFHSPARQTCEADFRSAPTRCWPVKGQSHREGFRFQPRACDNCRLKSLQFLSFLAFYPEPVTTALRQRTVTPTWQRYAVVAGAAGPRREPGSDNPNPHPDRSPRNPHPSLEHATVAKKYSPSWYFRGVPLSLDVFPGISRAGRGLEGREVHLCRRRPIRTEHEVSTSPGAGRRKATGR